MKNILTYSGSLTQKLKEVAKEHFAVRVLSEEFVELSPEHCLPLRLPYRQQVWCRETELLVDAEPWVQAKTYVPLETLQAEGKSILHLGENPLGELLFSDPHLRRTVFCFSGNTRSSTLYFYDKPVWIQETFLPVMLDHFDDYLLY